VHELSDLADKAAGRIERKSTGVALTLSHDSLRDKLPGLYRTAAWNADTIIVLPCECRHGARLTAAWAGLLPGQPEFG
jgi:hypothetical protein